WSSHRPGSSSLGWSPVSLASSPARSKMLLQLLHAPEEVLGASHQLGKGLRSGLNGRPHRCLADEGRSGAKAKEPARTGASVHEVRKRGPESEQLNVGRQLADRRHTDWRRSGPRSPSVAFLVLLPAP